MEIRPAEISEILKKQIAAFDTEANVADYAVHDYRSLHIPTTRVGS